ncbi:MAG: hypothetical protein PHT07_15820 [Paludibacter sp.]|nr:hypothetical protein [Paludibacter sp.]
MNTFTKSDIQEIEKRINSITCPFCGGQSNIEINDRQNAVIDLFSYHTLNSCCQQFKEKTPQFIHKECERQINLKINRIINM